MSQAAQSSAKAPWHLWAVGVFGLLWNGYGCYDYVMTTTGGDAYLRSLGLDEAFVDYYAAMPAWMTGVWALGVWGGLLGSILLLLRSKWAYVVFVVSFAAYALSVVYTYLLSNGGEVAPEGAAIMHGVVALGCIFFVWYARTMKQRGLLR
jgi:hypothetical protein